MKKCFLALVIVFTSPFIALSQDSTMRPDIDELFAVMRLEKTMQEAMAQMTKMIPQMTANMMAKMPNLPAGAAEKSKASQEKVMAIVQEEMSWKKLKPMMAEVYAESLTPEEVKGITEFYKSPAGQAFLNKQPLIMQKSMAMQQKLMMEMMPKIQAAVQASVKAELESAKPAGTPAASPAP